MLDEVRNKEILKFPNLIVFVSSFCIMVLELVAGRMMAPYLGVSLYTWTSIIGVVLAGISVGNFLGGRVADSHLSRKTLGLAFFLAGLSSVGILYLVPAVGHFLEATSWPLALSTLIFSLLVFFPASVFLGCISPIVVKFDLKNLEKTGRTVGRIYAFGTIGSILGTFATGFVLISWFGTKYIVIGVAAVLIFLGFVISGLPKNFFRDKTNIIFSLVFLGSFALPVTCQEETNYYCITTQPQISKEGAHGYAMKLDHLIHSFVYPGREEVITYDYEKLYKILTDYFISKNSRADFSALFLGGGGYTMPRYFEKFYEASNLLVVEIDPAVTRFNYEHLDLDFESKIKTINLDARIFLERLPEDVKYDLIFGDAFNDFAIPYHLTTREFAQKIKEHLAPDGFYAANAIDNWKYGRFISSFAKTLKEVFPYVYLAPLEIDWEKDRRNTFVVLAGEVEIDKEKWNEILTKIKDNDEQYKNALLLGYFVPEDKILNFMKEKSAILLTDSHAPTDNLLAPVFNEGY